MRTCTLAARPAALLAVVAVLALVGCGGGGGDATGTMTDTQPSTTEITSPTTTQEEPADPTLVRIRVVDGASEGGIVRATVAEDARVVIVVTSDAADEVHLHGYDVSRPVAAGGTARLTFRATIPGRFEIELEERGVPIGELTVQP